MKNVIGLFDDASQARIAEQKVSGLGTVEHFTGTSSNARNRLSGYGLTGTELDGFCEGVRRGSELVVVRCDDKNAQKVADIFRGLPSVDINRRLERWRSQGWKGYDEKASLSEEDLRREREFGRNELHVPVIEESIAVGKREVERGGVRVETHVKETPVQENVQLREEQVRVEPHPVNRPATARDEIGERVVEMHARGEEAVVSKQAKVVEEIVVKKDAETRQETIRDTVKRTDVDVKQLDGEKRTSRTSATDRISRSSQI